MGLTITSGIHMMNMNNSYMNYSLMFIGTNLISNVLLSNGQDCWSVRRLNSYESTETSIFEHKWHHFNVILFLFVAFYWSWVGIKISSSLFPDPEYWTMIVFDKKKNNQTPVLNVKPSHHIHNTYMCTLLWPLLFSNANYIMEAQNKRSQKEVRFKFSQ